MNLSRKIKSLCALNGITQGELADKIRMSAGLMSRRMHCPDTFRIEELKRIAKVLKVSLAEIMMEG